MGGAHKKPRPKEGKQRLMFTMLAQRKHINTLEGEVEITRVRKSRISDKDITRLKVIGQ